MFYLQSDFFTLRIASERYHQCGTVESQFIFYEYGKASAKP